MMPYAPSTRYARPMSSSSSSSSRMTRGGNWAWLCCLLLQLSRTLEVKGQTSDDDDQRTKVACPTDRYYGDVPGLDLVCSSYPLPESKHEVCWTDNWWKSYADAIPNRIHVPNPLRFLDADACQKPCRCVLSLNLEQFKCAVQGAGLSWNDFNSANYLRKSFRCDTFSFPNDVAAQLTKVQLQLSLTGLTSRLDNSISSGGLQALVAAIPSIDSITINITSTSVGDSGADVVQQLLGRSTSSSMLKRLDVSYGAETGRLSGLGLTPVFGDNMTSQLRFLRFDSIDPMPDLSTMSIDRAAGLYSLTVIDSPSYVASPTWLSDAKHLRLLYFSQVSQQFDWNSLKPNPNVLQFALTNTPITQMPTNFAFSGCFPNLENLDLSNLRLTTIMPDALRNMDKLKFVDLSNNGLSAMPALSDLHQLQWLSLAGLTAYAAGYRPKSARVQAASDVCPASQPTLLSLHDADLQHLTSLQHLDISYYQSVTIEDAVFGHLAENLVTLVASCVGWTKLPDGLRNYCQLHTLDVPGNRLNTDTSVPTWLITEWTQLHKFDLSYNAIRSLPAWLTGSAEISPDLIDSLAVSFSRNPIANDTCAKSYFDQLQSQQHPLMMTTPSSQCPVPPLPNSDQSANTGNKCVPKVHTTSGNRGMFRETGLIYVIVELSVVFYAFFW